MGYCIWAGMNEANRIYHDTEWGIPVHDDRHMFEHLTLECLQCGLSWDLMLKKRYPRLFVEKKPGEVKKSMLMLFLMFAALIAVCWGVFGRPKLASTAIFMWGIGDASAALIGIPFGRHKVKSKLTVGKKSWEGTAEMFLVSFLGGLGMLLLAQGMALPSAAVFALPGALMGTATELVSPSEYDTVTVPVVISKGSVLVY